MSSTEKVSKLCARITSGLDAEKREAALDGVHQTLKECDVNYELLTELLEAELSHSFFEQDHFEKTKASQEFFSVEQADVACRVLGSLFPRQRFEGPGVLPEMPPSEAEVAQQELNTNGFFVFPNRLDTAACDRLTRAFGEIDFRVKATGELVRGYHREKAERINGNTCWIVDQQAVMRIPEVQRLASDPTILNLIQGYLGCVPVHDQANCWWTVNYQNDQKSMKSDAQLYHQDRDYIRFVKVFVYLNDVTDQNGPHEYIRGSARDYQEHTPSRYVAGQRLDDAYLRDRYGSDRFVSFKGERGTIILEDTGGFHKGTPVIRGHRLMLQLEYCCSLYMRPGVSFSLDGLTPEYASMAEQHPRLFLNYSDQRYQQESAMRHRATAADANRLSKRIRRISRQLRQWSGIKRAKKAAA